jgi:hypothetical protein
MTPSFRVEVKVLEDFRFGVFGETDVSAGVPITSLAVAGFAMPISLCMDDVTEKYRDKRNNIIWETRSHRQILIWYPVK